MLPKENRLRKEKDFEGVFKSGKGFKKDFLFLKIKENDLAESRLGFILSKRAFKKATLRNKMKRRLREQIYKRLPKIKKGFDLVLVGQAGLEKLDFWQTDKMLEALLLKAGLINAD